jgi:predicted ester cyclase
MNHHDPTSIKPAVLAKLRRLADASVADLPSVAGDLFAPDATYLAAHPINQMTGLDELLARHLIPLKTAMPDLARRDDIFMGGHFDGYDWVSATGYYYGTLTGEWLGLRPTDNWLYIRFGEFYKLDGGRVIDAYVILDLVDVFRQLGVNPIRRGLGIETLIPGPFEQDGLILAAQDPNETAKSLKLVESMIFEGMWGFDGVDHSTMNMDRYFTDDLMWYGPGGIGTTRGFANFMRYHEEPWNEAFPDFRGGNHKARFADGAFICSTGWPSIHGTHGGGDLFGLAPTGKPVTIRVMDWWRRRDALLSENWIFVDVPELMLQLGRDVLAEAQGLQPHRR